MKKSVRSTRFKSRLLMLISLNVSKIVYLAISLFLTVNVVQANLFIIPKRIVLEGTERSASIILVNTSDVKTTYRLKWIQKRQLPDGRFVDLPIDSKEVKSASEILKFSPHQFTLSTNERQVVRIALRRNKKLNVGERRSHLTFQAISNNENTGYPFNIGPPTERQLLWSYSVPVIVRKGKLDASAKITSIELRKTVVAMGKMTYNTKITLNGAGVNTAIGSLKILWKGKSGSEYRLIGNLNDVTLYPESASVRFHVGLTIRNPSEGSIKVIYLGTKEFENTIFDESIKRVVRSDFKFEIEK